MKIFITGKQGEGKSTIGFAITELLNNLGIDVTFFEHEENKTYFDPISQSDRLEKIRHRTTVEIRTGISHDSN